MREIKFIYTIKRTNGFLFSSKPFTLEDIESGKAEFFLNHNLVYDPDTIFRRAYTGLHDKNGKEIYEGDMVCCFGSNYQFHHPVEFNEGSFGYWTYKDEPFKDFISFECNTNFKWSNNKSEHIEIIGNIYSNPELLSPSPQSAK